MKKYLSHTRRLAAATPPERNRVVDFWRAAAILTVVFGHWLAASIWLTPGGETKLLNSLEWVPYASWVTWIVQVMPVFFIAGGYANARGLSRVQSGDELRREWITARVRRLFTPVIPLLIVWVGLVLVLRQLLPADIVRAGAMSATVPLWFLAVYLILTALAPFTHRWWQHSGMRSVATLVGAAAAVDFARFVLSVPGIGWINFLFVWAAVHQLGYSWADRDQHSGVTARTGWIVAGSSVALLVALTTAGAYPVAMVGIPGAGLTNMTPPTLAMVILGTMQLGIIWGTQGVVRRFVATERGWHAVVAVSGMIMTIYLWHLSAMSLVGATGLFTFGGIVFQVEPGSGLWWVTRPLWLAVLSAATLGLAFVFARFEWRISRSPAPRTVLVVIAGLMLTAGSATMVAVDGLTTADGRVQWLIPATALLGAAALGALPKRNAG
ncbi:MAG: acyltransferase [bacterium]|nr:acyltransferase [bacterium]